MTTAFSLAYPSGRSLPGHVFRPLVDPRSYLRALHLMLMFPLGIAYFVLFVTAFAVGGSLVWTFIGPPVLLLAMFISLWLGDAEAWLVNLVTGAGIRRPPSRLEGLTSLRQKVWARVIDPSTWMGLVYEVAQFPIGIAGFALVVTSFTVAGSLIVAPLVVWLSDGPLVPEDALNIGFNSPVEALPLVPLGFLLFLVSVQLVVLFSAVHASWARLMLGSRSRRTPAADAPSETPPLPPDAPVALLPPPEAGSDGPEEVAVAAAAGGGRDGPQALTRMPVAYEALTAREREVLLLLARGFSNADIGETCYISEGTVKTHVGNILSKLQLRDRTQVVVFAYEAGLVRPGQGDIDGLAAVASLT